MARQTAAQHTTDKQESVSVDIDAINRDGPVVPGGSGTLTNFLFESKKQRAEAGARLWGWMYEDVEDIQTDASPRQAAQGSTTPLRARSYTTPARMPESAPYQSGEQQPAAEVRSPEPEPEPETAEGTPQP